MTDLIERIRYVRCCDDSLEAADEIERLRVGLQHVRNTAAANGEDVTYALVTKILEVCGGDG